MSKSQACAASANGSSSSSLVHPTGTLILTEATPRKRGSLHVVSGEAALAEFSRGGLEVPDCTLDAFTEALTRENHTLTRALTDPRLLSGIGNAYSDEILHAARLSPLTLTSRLQPDDVARLWSATRETLTMWSARLREQNGAGFPTHRRRRQRVQRLPHVPDRRQTARGPRHVAPAQERLAQEPGRMGGARSGAAPH